MESNKIYVGEKKPKNGLHLCPGKNLYTGIKYFEKEFGVSDSIEEDLLNVASGIYASDLAIKRNERENYLRTISLTIEVVNIHAFQRVKSLIEASLLILSRDNWEINFIEKKGKPSSGFIWQKKEGAVLLFSGGLDSMSAASDFINKNKNLVLLSHNTHANKVVDKSQRNVLSVLETHYNKKIRHVHIKVYGRKNTTFHFPDPIERENTQRTRSFLFLALATLTTKRAGFNKVLFMAENGQFAIHLPLNSARVGPFSTHTADPEFVSNAQEIFKTLLSNPDFEISNPFLFKTKAEVVSLLPKQLHSKLSSSASCWMISHVPGEKHCGFCIPCISRRIALEYNNIHLKEYHIDIFKTDINILPDTDTGKRNLTDYLEFITRFKKATPKNKVELICDFPELINPAFEIDDAIKLYERVSAQSFQVLSHYPRMQKLLK